MLACNRALCKERKGKGENECEWDEGEKVVLGARTGFCRGLGRRASCQCSDALAMALRVAARLDGVGALRMASGTRWARRA